MATCQKTDSGQESKSELKKWTNEWSAMKKYYYIEKLRKRTTAKIRNILNLILNLLPYMVNRITWSIKVLSIKDTNHNKVFNWNSKKGEHRVPKNVIVVSEIVAFLAEVVGRRGVAVTEAAWRVWVVLEQKR